MSMLSRCWLAGAVVIAASAASAQTFVRSFPDLPSISPFSIAVDPAGNYWVANFYQGGLSKLAPGGQELLRVPDIFRAAAGGPYSFTQPNGIAAGTNGIYVADGNYVIRFTLQGQYVSWFGGPGTGPGQISRAGGVAVSVSTGDVYVTDLATDRVLRFASDGTFLAQFGTRGALPGQFVFDYDMAAQAYYENAAIAVDANGDVLVLDAGNSRVQRFDSAGNAISQFGLVNWGLLPIGSSSAFDRGGLSVAPDGNVFVCRQTAYYVNPSPPPPTIPVHNVTEYSPGGAQLASLLYGSAFGVAAVASHHVAVAEFGAGEVSVWSTSGGTGVKVQSLGNAGASIDGRFVQCRSIVHAPTGELLVGDSTNRVQYFDANGNYLSKILLQARPPLSPSQQYTTYASTFLSRDDLGNLYAFVTEWGPRAGGVYGYEYSVRKWSSAGVLLQVFGERDVNAIYPGTPPATGQYGSVMGLTPDGSGGVWISDGQWDRLLHFDATGSLVATVGTEGSLPGQFNMPRGLTRLSNGDLLVCDYLNSRMQRLDGDGDYLSSFGCTAPSVVALSSDQTQLFIGSPSTFRVSVYTITGAPLAKLGVYGGGPGELADADALAHQGNILAIAEGTNNRVSLFDVSLLDQQVPVVTITSPTPTNAFDGVLVSGGSVTLAAQITDASQSTVTSSPAGVFTILPPGGGAVSGTVVYPYTGSGDTAYNFAVNAVDTSGNSGGASILVKRDVNAPTNWGVSYVDNTVIGTSSVNLSLQVYDYTSKTVTVSHGGGTHFQGGSGYLSRTITVSGLQNGPNAITLTATDAAGHSSAYTRTLIADLTAPVITFVGLGGPADPDCYGPGQSPLPVTVQVTDYAATSLSSTPSASWGGSLPQGGGTRTANFNLVQGPNTITVRAQDQYGRLSSVSTTVLYDLTAPTVAFDSPASSQLVRGTLHVVVDADDLFGNGTPGCGVDSVALAVDSVPVGTLTEAPYELDLATIGLTEGSHTLTAVATDGVGNVSTTSVAFVVDNTAPTVTITAPTANAIVGGNDLPFTATASDANGITVVQMLAGTNAPNDTDGSVTYATPVTSASVASVYDTVPLPDGSLLLKVTARDAAGNEASAELTVVVDNTAPEKALVSPTDGATVTGVVPIVASASDPNLTSLVIKVDGNVVGSTASSSLTVNFDTMARGEGPMTIEVVVTDAANNTSSCTATVYVVNLTWDFDPDTLSLKNKGQGVVTAHLEGPTVPNLVPIASHRIELRVQGGNSVSALSAGGVGDSDADTVPDLTIRFDRATLINSIKAGVLGNFLPADGLIQIELWIDGNRVGSSPVRIKS